MLREGPKAFQTLDGPQAEGLQERWQALRASCPEIAEKLGHEKTDSLATLDTRTSLSFVQNIVARAAADAAGADFMRVETRENKHGVPIVVPPPEDRKRELARVRSASGAAASGFLLALPCSKWTTMGDLTFTTAVRHRFGLRAYPDTMIPPCKCKGENVGKPDHPVYCSDLALDVQLRHNNTYQSLRHIVNCAGLCGSEEPSYRKQRGASGRGNEGHHRADLLIVLPGADVTVIYPMQTNMLGQMWH